MAIPGDASGTDLSNLSDEQKHAITESYAILELFMKSFNEGNQEGLKKAFTWPTVRIASGSIKILENVEETNIREMQQKGQEKELEKKAFGNWGHSEWAYRKVVQVGKDKVHWDTCFVRFDKDGKETGRFISLYVVAFVPEEKRWGIQCRSSFAP